MKEHDLYTDSMDRVAANLIFKKSDTKSHFLSFDKFCLALYDLALERFPWEKNRSIVFQQYVKNMILTKKLWNRPELKMYGRVRDELALEEVQAFIAEQKPAFDKYFNEICQDIKIEGAMHKNIDVTRANKLAIDL